MADYLESLVNRGVISNKAAARMMTHQAEQPNPVRPIVDAVRGYLQSGDYNPVHNPGTEPKDYLRELARDPAILAKNIDQASNFNFGGVMKPIKGAGVGAELSSAEASRQFAEEMDAFRQGWKEWKKTNPFVERDKRLADAWDRGQAKRNSSKK